MQHRSTRQVFSHSRSELIHIRLLERIRSECPQLLSVYLVYQKFPWISAQQLVQLLTQRGQSFANVHRSTMLRWQRRIDRMRSEVADSLS